MAISLDFIRDRIGGLRKQCEGQEGASDISLAHFTSAFDVPAAHWSKMFHESGNYLLSAPYLASLEQHPYRGMCFHYIVAYQREDPVAILYYQETDVHITNVDKNVDTDKVGDTSSFFSKAKGVIASSLESVKARLLIQGNLLQSGEHGAYFSESLSDEVRATIVDAAWRKIVDANKSGKKIRCILIKDINEDLRKQVQILDKDFASFAVQPNMVSEIRENWKSFDDVLEDFASKYRVRAKKCIKQAEHLLLKEFNADDIQKHNDTIMQLFKNVEAGADFHMVSIHPRYFVDLKAALEDRFVLKGYFNDEDELIGFYSYIKGVDRNYASFVGLNYDYNRECSLYQNILYNLLDDSINDGAKSIDLARTAMEIKSTMGAEPQNYQLMVKHLNPITNSIVKRFIQNLRPKEWTQRKPFKD
ncbi:MAG: GNAT family N-acetyltransferase [Flavobacteriales bacterium]|nr:GNAT family N-acetyltransferase [Flavobacteriales bacterium]MCB9190431.1 GNAT family N-acetyltransferase [Flavobacteriales bacterium]